jgi:hypothetical protein
MLNNVCCPYRLFLFYIICIHTQVHWSPCAYRIVPLHFFHYLNALNLFRLEGYVYKGTNKQQMNDCINLSTTQVRLMDSLVVPWRNRVSSPLTWPFSHPHLVTQFSSFYLCFPKMLHSAPCRPRPCQSLLSNPPQSSTVRSLSSTWAISTGATGEEGQKNMNGEELLWLLCVSGVRTSDIC